jgi:Ca-activated chloride channel family protein
MFLRPIHAANVGKEVDMSYGEMRVGLLVLTATLAASSTALGSAPQDQGKPPVFRAVTDRVTVAATVRDSHGKPVTTLKAENFQLLDNGQTRPILEFQRDKAPMSIAILADYSGSMDVASKRSAAREVVRQIVGWLMPGEDRVGLYAFDLELREVQPLSPAPSDVVRQMDKLEPWGKTRLLDAIAETGRKLAATNAGRRAVVVLTDGDDNASLMTASQVSGLASSIDVPVYIVLVVSPLDRVGKTTTSLIDPHLAEQRDGALGNLARWTGGDILVPVSEAETLAATKQIVDELRQQYLLGFEPGTQPGWHPLELRTKPTLIVRARSGYLVPGAASMLNHDPSR